MEAAKLNQGDVVRSAIIEIFAESNPLLAAVPFEDIEGNAIRYNQEDTLPGVAFRGLNEAYTESVGVINPQTEHLVIGGGDLDVDRFIVDTMGANQRTAHETMKAKKLAQTIANRMIKGDSSSAPKEFDGLQVRLTGDQLIENVSAGTGVALSLNSLDEAIDAVDMPTHLLMNKAMRRRLTAASRNSGVGGYITYQQDEFGRQQAMYGELPILIADHNADSFNTLAFDEAAGGGGSTSTSIYVLSLMPGMLHGIQNGVMDVRDLGELEEKPVYRTRIEWYVGMMLEHPRAAARLRGITDAAVVA